MTIDPSQARFDQLLDFFAKTVPQGQQDHMFCYFSRHAGLASVPPFLGGMISALVLVDSASPGYAEEMIRRMSGIGGIGEDKHEALVQVLAEVFVTAGAVESAAQGSLSIEPGKKHAKNPEFEVQVEGVWYAVEVKTPSLIKHSRQRHGNQFQLPARGPSLSEFIAGNTTLPRDNPVKDFLLSAQVKFASYHAHRPDAYTVLAVVWNDHIQEVVSPLLHEHCGLLTPESFLRGADGKAVVFPNVDAILLLRHSHQLLRATAELPLLDGLDSAFRYHGVEFPPKAIVQVRTDRRLPDCVYAALDAVPISALQEMGMAEYIPMDLISWYPATRRSPPGEEP